MSPRSKEASRATGKDYGYANARIRGMKSHLLSRAFLDELIVAQDLGQFIQPLMDTDYAGDLDEALIRGRDAAAVDEALKNNMVRTYQKVLGFLNQEASFILTTLLGRWDVFNLKTIVRGKQMHLVQGEIDEGLLAAGQLSSVDLLALAKAEDIKGLVDLASTWGLPYAHALREGYGQFMASGDLAQLELALDRHYADWARERLQKSRANITMARKILGIQVDTMNLVTVMRFQKADHESFKPEQFFLEGGAAIHLPLYVELASLSDVDQVLDRLRGTPYGKLLDDVAVKFIEANSISVFERALEDYLMRRALNLGVGDPLGIGVGISYLWAKQNEITNLRIIVKGKSVGMPLERVRGELILV
jgi:V/A-type H+/Na+-transporting ATPase subunit C